MRRVVCGGRRAATLATTRTRTITRALWGGPCLDAVACEVRPSWMLCFADADTVLWKDARVIPRYHKGASYSKNFMSSLHELSISPETLMTSKAFVGVARPTLPCAIPQTSTLVKLLY